MVSGNIKAEVARRGLSLRKIAPMMGITPNTLNNKVNGKRAWLLREAVMLVDILNRHGDAVSIVDLFELEPTDEN